MAMQYNYTTCCVLECALELDLTPKNGAVCVDQAKAKYHVTAAMISYTDC